MSNIARRRESPPAKNAPAKKAPGKKAAAKKAPAKKAPAKKAPAKKAPAKKAPAKKAPAKKVPGKKAHGRKVTGAATAGKNARAKSASGQRKSESNTTKGAGKTRKALPAAPVDPLIILGLTEQYTLADLRRSWRAYAGRHHPDKGGDAATFTRGLAAYETLARRFP
jgi:hypothetical protein